MSAGSVQRPSVIDDAPRIVERAALELAAKVETVKLPGDREFTRLEAAVEPFDILQWLRGAPAGARRYFRDRSTKFEFAGIGIAVSCGAV
jgi:hypothetical protein